MQLSKIQIKQIQLDFFKFAVHSEKTYKPSNWEFLIDIYSSDLGDDMGWHLIKSPPQPWRLFFFISQASDQHAAVHEVKDVETFDLEVWCSKKGPQGGPTLT